MYGGGPGRGAAEWAGRIVVRYGVWSGVGRLGVGEGVGGGGADRELSQWHVMCVELGRYAAITAMAMFEHLFLMLIG